MTIKYIIITSDSTAPAAALNRCNLLSKGISSNGSKSFVRVFRIEKSRNIIRKAFTAFNYLFTMITVLLFTRKSEAIILYGTFPGLSFLRLFRSKRYLMIAERNEYPEYLISNDALSKASKRSLSYSRNLDLFDGLITCTETLASFYKPLINLDCKILIIPLVVDTQKFSLPNVKRKDYITYCGDFGRNKDGVPILIRAFSKLSASHPAYKLRLIGSTDHKEDLEHIFGLVKELGLETKVEFTGSVSHMLMPMLLSESTILALARPSNKQAEGGFPSKLAEYLCTGVPSLITRVGEIDRYLVDKVDVFFSIPNSVDDFADDLKEILDDYNFALKVARNGKVKVEEYDYKNQAFILIDFVNNVRSNNV